MTILMMVIKNAQNIKISHILITCFYSCTFLYFFVCRYLYVYLYNSRV